MLRHRTRIPGVADFDTSARRASRRALPGRSRAVARSLFDAVGATGARSRRPLSCSVKVARPALYAVDVEAFEMFDEHVDDRCRLPYFAGALRGHLPLYLAADEHEG
jgi:hypothetical protein